MCVYSIQNDRINAANSAYVVKENGIINKQMGSLLSFQVTFYPYIKIGPLKWALVA